MFYNPNERPTVSIKFFLSVFFISSTNFCYVFIKNFLTICGEHAMGIVSFCIVINCLCACVQFNVQTCPLSN